MATSNIIISTVKMDERKALGVRAGDTVRVEQRIVEKSEKDDKIKVRLQAFEGIVLAVKHGTEAGSTFTVRKVVDGVGVERIFPLYSPMIEEIEIVKRANVHKAKLYYIRDKAAKEIRKEMKSQLHVIGRTADVGGKPVSAAEAKAAVAEEEAAAVKE